MNLNLTRVVLVALILTLVSGCATVTPAPTPAPTVVAAQSVPTQTPYPTATLYPTQTPYPTATLLPTLTPAPIVASRLAATPVPECVDDVFRLRCLYAERASMLATASAPVVVLPPAPRGSADLWRTPGTYKPVAANLCATYISSYENRDWEETFCIIQVDVTSNVIRFYGHWKIKLIKGSFRERIYHLGSRGVTYSVDNLGNKYIHGRLGGAADEDRFIQSTDYLMGYKDNQNVIFPHEPDSWWEFEPARPGASSFTFVNDKYGFRIGPIVLSK